MVKKIFLIVLCCIFWVGNVTAQTSSETTPSQAAGNSADLKSTPPEGLDIDLEIKSFNEKALRFNVLFVSTAARVLAVYVEPSDLTRKNELSALTMLTAESKLEYDILKSLIPELSRDLEKMTSETDFILRTQQLPFDEKRQLNILLLRFALQMIQFKTLTESFKKILADKKPENLTKILPVLNEVPRMVASLNSLSVSFSKISKALKSEKN